MKRRDTGLDRKTVRRYVEAAELLGVRREGELRDDDVRAVAQRVMDRDDPPPCAERLVLGPHREQIKAWLEGDAPLKLTKVRDLLVRRGVEVTYPTLRRFVIAELGWHTLIGSMNALLRPYDI